MKKQDKAEVNETSPPEDTRTPFERFEDFARRIVRVPKSEIPKEQWTRRYPRDKS